MHIEKQGKLYGYMHQDTVYYDWKNDFFFYPLIYFYFCFDHWFFYLIFLFCFDLELEMIIYFDLFYMSYNDTKKNPTQ
jgi:hypothetical protein